MRGRRASEAASRAAINALGIVDVRPAAHLGRDDRDLRRGLRAKREQLGDEPGEIELLVAECAYEQWHQLLFARFLAENNLLIHPQFGAPVTLVECGELAADLGEPDGWAVASRFAADILPGIFRLDDPCVRLRVAPEGRLELERIVESITAQTFAADDALGWVYQHWQRERKDEVNASERKIGGADLAPVTQLFTESYMVRFLLENSLGAWWASRYPDSPLVREWRYLRVDEGGKPVVGAFEGWPSVVSEVTVMDPCCGSGHFLVESFEMLWRMRAEEEGLAPVAAQDAVLRDNLFGLELDPRCVQIAMFAVALQAWKAARGWRQLPVPNLACSGIPVKASVDKWKALAGGDYRLENALVRLHVLFRDADTLGSLIDPRRATEGLDSSGTQPSFDDIDWKEIAPLLRDAATHERTDPAAAVLGADACAIADAADMLSRQPTLIATNVPWLKRGKQDEQLAAYSDRHHAVARADLATTFLHRWLRRQSPEPTAAFVSPQVWLTLGTYKSFREWMLTDLDWKLVARLGSGAFETISGEVVNPLLAVLAGQAAGSSFAAVDVPAGTSAREKAEWLRTSELLMCDQNSERLNPDSRVTFSAASRGSTDLLSAYADGLVGMQTSDDPRYRFFFWEVFEWGEVWEPLQDVPEQNVGSSGCTGIVRWEQGHGSLSTVSRAWQGRKAWGRSGVIVSRFGTFNASLYGGHKFHQNAAVILPFHEDLTAAVLAYCQSEVFEADVRRIDKKMNVTNATLVKVPFDAERWRREADRLGPLREPHSDDPTEWLFNGRPESATEPLQAAVARLLGYRWPEQVDSDDLNPLADGDGIVCLPSVLGERSAADRLQELLARAFGGTWSPARAAELLALAGSKKGNLDLWLRDEFFKAHCQTFKNRPFIWHVWDGRKDGFSALLNYHRLDRPTLERLAYTYLGDWVERQAAGAREDVVGAEERLVAARDLQRKLELILVGDPPYDIYVRWKPYAEQAIGWAPDLDDGVRLNVRPFVQAEVLRARFNVKWEKDRGKDADGSERHNDFHLTNAQKHAARDGVGV